MIVIKSSCIRSFALALFLDPSRGWPFQMALRALWLAAAVASSHGAVLTSRAGGTRAATPLRRMSGPVVLQVPQGDHIVSSSHHEPARHQPASLTRPSTRARTALDVNSLEKGIPRFRPPEELQ